MSACNKCQRSEECQQGRHCHLNTSLTDGFSMMVIILAGAAAICAAVIDIITSLGK